MTTLAQTIERTRRHLYSGETADARDRLAEPVNSSEVNLTLDFGQTGVQPGATLSIDLEEMHVWQADTNTAPMVERGDHGSTATSHTNQTIVYVNAKFSAFMILEAINDELDALSTELYRLGSLDITYDAGTDAYDLTGVTSLTSIIDVESSANDGTDRWNTLDPSLWSLKRDLPTADFPSGMALTINGSVESGMAMRVAYKGTFTRLSALTDTLETTAGLHAQAHDIVVLGAAVRLIAGAEVSRNFLEQGETRRADEVGPGSRTAMVRGLAALRAQRIEQEKARLYAMRPTVRR